NSLQLAVAKYLYDPFGNSISAGGPWADVNLYRFSSKEAHIGSELYYYGRRFYEPCLQRWLNRDPLQEVEGINIYTFVRNAPVIRSDAFGLESSKGFGYEIKTATQVFRGVVDFGDKTAMLKFVDAVQTVE